MHLGLLLVFEVEIDQQSGSESYDDDQCCYYCCHSYLRNPDQSVTHRLLYAGDGRGCEVVSARKPFRHFRVTLAKPAGKLMLSDALLLQDGIKSLRYTIRQLELCPLFLGNSGKTLSEKFVRYHVYVCYIVNVALSIPVIMFFSMRTVPFFWASARALSKDCRSTT